MRTASKYRAVKTIVDGIKFDSRAEAVRYGELKLLQKAGKITRLILQPAYELIPPFKRNGKTHRAVIYKADFCYIENGCLHIEDVKGFATADFKNKMKLFLFKHGADIKYYLIKRGVKYEI